MFIENVIYLMILCLNHVICKIVYRNRIQVTERVPAYKNFTETADMRAGTINTLEWVALNCVLVAAAARMFDMFDVGVMERLQWRLMCATQMQNGGTTITSAQTFTLQPQVKK